MFRIDEVTSLALVALASSGGSALAQESACEGRERPSIGVVRYHCPGGSCSYHRTLVRVEAEDTLKSSFDFATEPVLLDIDPDGPAAGELRPGDILVAVNGYLITSVRGGVELANLPFAEDAILTVRRGVRLLPATIKPEASCSAPVLHLGRWDSQSGWARSTWSQTTWRGGRFSRNGWLGISLGRSLDCDSDTCSFNISRDETGSIIWRLPIPLEVVGVEVGGPADQAGISLGDVVVSVDGMAADRKEAAGVLRSLRLGQEVEIIIRRDGREEPIVVVAGAAPARVPEALRVPSVITVGADRLGLLLRLRARLVIRDGVLGGNFITYPEVAEVQPGSPADEAGLRRRDIITHVNGVDLKSEDAGRLILSPSSGQRFRIRFQRGEEEMTTVLIAQN